MLVDLHLSIYTGVTVDHEVTRKTIEAHHAQADAGKFYKNIVPATLIKPIRNYGNVIRKWHYFETCAWLDNGKRILPVDQYFRYMEGAADHQDKFWELVSDFCKSIDTIIENNNYRLGDMFKEGEIPSPDDIRQRFRFDVDILPTPTAGDFRAAIAEEEIERVQHNLEVLAHEAVEEITTDLWNRVYKSVAHLHERMVKYYVDPETGKTQNKLYASTVDNLKELLELLPVLNVTNNSDLENMRQEMLEKLTPHDTDTLKGNQNLRDEVRDAAADIMKRMQGYTG
jgi:hypothetical protein